MGQVRSRAGPGAAVHSLGVALVAYAGEESSVLTAETSTKTTKPPREGGEPASWAGTLPRAPFCVLSQLVVAATH